EGERPHLCRISRRKDLADAGAGVVADEIDSVDLRRVEKSGDHPRLLGKRDAPPRRDLGVAEAHRIRRDTPPHGGEILENVAPLVSAERKPMEEERGSPGAPLYIGDAAEGRFDEFAARAEFGWSH